MTVKELQQLHLRSVSGGVLNADEKIELETWYADMDKAEAFILNRSAVSKPSEDLDARIAEAARHLVEASNRLQQTIHENALLRKEIENLDNKLAQKFADSAA